MEISPENRTALERKLMTYQLLRLNRYALEQEEITPEIYYKIDARIRASEYSR